MFEIWSSRKYLSQNDSMNSLNFSQDDSFEHTKASTKSSFHFIILWNSNSLDRSEYAYHKTPHESSEYWSKIVLLVKSEVYVQQAVCRYRAQEGNYANIILNGNTLYLSIARPRLARLVVLHFPHCFGFSVFTWLITSNTWSRDTCLTKRWRHFLPSISVRTISLITLLWVLFPICVCD